MEQTKRPWGGRKERERRKEEGGKTIFQEENALDRTMPQWLHYGLQTLNTASSFLVCHEDKQRAVRHT